MAAGGSKEPSREPGLIYWDLLSPAGPSLAMHVGSIFGNSLYVHGGITKYGSNDPSDKLYRLDLTSLIWNEVREPGSPTLSHHACVNLHNRYLLLIGGWNGRQRSPTVFAFDTQDQRWIFPRDSGFHEGAGLSSHTTTLLDNGGILVVGREGGLRMHRKHGTAHLLTGDLEKGYKYIPYTSGTASRSGHTANTIGSTLYIIGGRDDQFVEFHSGFKALEPIGKVTSKFAEIGDLLKPLSKIPGGRKNHITVSGTGALLIHGGETFDGRSREPVGEMFLMTTKPNFRFYKLNNQVGRAGHVCCSMGDRVIFHGGFAGKGVMYGDCYELKLM